MDEAFRKVETQLDQYLEADDNTKFWKRWSRTVETSFLRFMGKGAEHSREAKGRGKPTLMTTSSKDEVNEDDVLERVKNKETK